MICNQTQTKMAILKSDRGGEFTSLEFERFLSEHGIIHEMGPAESPEQNSVVERFMRTLASRLRSILIHGNLPIRFWGEVLMATSFILNLCPSKSVSMSCPEHAWQIDALNVVSPKIRYNRLRILGCLAFTVPPGHRGKLSPRSIKTILIGYEKNSNAYRLWEPKSNRIIVSNDVVFNESTFPLRELDHTSTEELTVLNDQMWDDAWESTISVPPTEPPPPSPLEGEQVEDQAPSPQHQARRSNRNIHPVERLGNLMGYHTVSDLDHHPPSDIDDGPQHDEPSYLKAMRGPNREDWMSAMTAEFTSLQNHSVGRLVEAPPDANILPGMWRLKRKRDEFGRISKYKARWVAGGNHQIKGVDFDSTYASVGLTDTLRTLYALAASENLEMAQFDIETAFLNGKMKHRVYVRQVTGFRCKSNPTHVMELDKSLYGTCQAHREFNEDLDGKLRQLGFNVCPVDNSLYTLRRGSSFIHIPMHVDDGMAFSNDSSMLHQFRNDLKQFYKFRWTENPSLHLGIHISRNRAERTITLDQSHYCHNMLERFGMTECNGVKTPLPTNVKLSSPLVEDCSEIEHYRAATGMLNFLALQTRPDISFAVSYLCRFNSRHNDAHWAAVKHLLRYVKHTLSFKLTFGTHRGQNGLVEGYADADYAGDVDTRRSTTGFVFFVHGSLVSWKSKRQHSVTLSTTEAEYLAIGDCAKHGLWLCRLLEHLHQQSSIQFPIKLPLSNDNQGAVFLCNEASVNNKSKHIDIRHHFIRELTRAGKITVSHVSTKDMPADVLTKPVGPVILSTSYNQLGISQVKG